MSITSCSDTAGGGTQVAEGGISGTGISSGSITGFSSVIVNGRKLEVDNQTEIFVDEQSATETDLRVGYVIRVEADFDNNSADRIDYVETVRGPLIALPVFNPDTLVGSFSLLGQSVVTNSVTLFDELLELTSLNIGDVLEVSGVRDSSGAIIARYLSLKTAPTEYRVLGIVANVTETTFDIGNLSVDYSGADISELDGGIENGAELRVKGPATSYESAANTFLATKITPSSLKVDLVSGDDIELEGAITDFQSISSFEVNGKTVDASGAIFENGNAEELKLDLLVEVEGSVDTPDILNASRIKIIPIGNIRVESAVDSVGADGLSIMVQGQQFILDEKTQLEDKSSARINVFSLSDLSPGDWVDLRSYRLNSQYFLTRLERDDPKSDVRIQAPVDTDGVDPTNKTISLLGIIISTSADTDYEDISDQPILESQFFNTVQASDLVRAKWKDFTDISLPVDELSLED
jgi:hypothetical protein